MATAKVVTPVFRVSFPSVFEPAPPMKGEGQSADKKPKYEVTMVFDPKTFTKEDIEGQWKTLVGPAAAKHTRPAALRKGMLTVFVDTSDWLQQMTLQKRKTLKQLKRSFGKDRILGIHFRIGEI